MERVASAVRNPSHGPGRPHGRPRPAHPAVLPSRSLARMDRLDLRPLPIAPVRSISPRPIHALVAAAAALLAGGTTLADATTTARASDSAAPDTPASTVTAADRLADPVTWINEAFDRHAGSVLARVRIIWPVQIDVIEAAGGDQWTHGLRPGWHDFLLTPAAQDAVQQLGLEMDVLRPDVGAIVAAERLRMARGLLGPDPRLDGIAIPTIDDLNPNGRRGGVLGGGLKTGSDAEAAARAGAPNAANAAGFDFFADYRPIDVIEQFTDGLVADHPDLVAKTSAGSSLEGRDIPVLSITGAGEPAEKPAVVLNAMQHAREWITVPTTLWFVDQLLDRYGSDPEVTALLDAIELQVIYLVNPDGYEFSITDDRFWRKNRRDNGDGTFGVDLNRNWGFQWGGPGSDSETFSLTYRGREPFSEPETQVVRDFILDRDDVVAHVDIHSYGQLILWPFGYDFVQPEGIHLHVHRELAFAMADAIAGVEGTAYAPQPGSDLYLASGIASDWVFGETGAISFTLELRPADGAGGGFVLPPDQIVPTGVENFESFLLLCEEVAAGVRWSYVDGVPAVVDRTNPAPIRVAPLPIATSELDPATATAELRSGGSLVAVVDLAPSIEDGVYDLLVPADLACGTALELTVTIDSVDGRTFVYPERGSKIAVTTEIRDVETRFADDAETDPGWTVTANAATGGVWDRGVPAGNGDRLDPTFDADGSGAAWLTENGAGNTDVDGGPTTLDSPVIDLSGLIDPTLSAALWMRNDDGDGDRLRTYVSDDAGGTWIEVDALAGGPPVWRDLDVRIADWVTPNDQFRVRFEVDDTPNNSITEAGVDAIRITDVRCGGSPDVDGDGVVGFDDLLAVLGAWGPCAGCPEDVDGNGDVGLPDLLAVLAAFE